MLVPKLDILPPKSLTMTLEDVIVPWLNSRFSRDVTAAMLVYRTIAKKVFWNFDSIIMQNLRDISPLFCTPTWPSHHVRENQEYKWEKSKADQTGKGIYVLFYPIFRKALSFFIRMLTNHFFYQPTHFVATRWRKVVRDSFTPFHVTYTEVRRLCIVSVFPPSFILFFFGSVVDPGRYFASTSYIRAPIVISVPLLWNSASVAGSSDEFALLCLVHCSQKSGSDGVWEE